MAVCVGNPYGASGTFRLEAEASAGSKPAHNLG
jgi:hypothetical protein